MNTYYSKDKNILMLISLLKQNNIKKVVVSPGTANVYVVASLQYDGQFEMYSAVDERGAAYLACGLASESGEPVMLTCTGATASRNYFPGLTEAFYRKLPILAVTSASVDIYPHNLAPQYIDRSSQPRDTVKYSVRLPVINSEKDIEESNLKINRAIWELHKDGGGPVHIDLPTDWRGKLTEKVLPLARCICNYTYEDDLPQIPCDYKTAIIVGAHMKWTKELMVAIETFCERYNSVVLVEHSSGYRGRYHVKPTVLAAQEMYVSPCFSVDLLIHIGNTIGDVYTNRRLTYAKSVWRVSKDGLLRDTFKRLSKNFEMDETFFFEAYNKKAEEKKDLSFFNELNFESQKILESLPDIPFSSIWAARTIVGSIPEFSNVHLGIGNVMRAFNLFHFPKGINATANTGGWGIDGALSTGLGISLVDPKKLTFIFLGDLAFFYDMNSLGNRHVGHNLRIMLLNNGKGVEMRIHESGVQKNLGDLADYFSAAGGHFGNQSRKLVKHYAENLGFKYLSADSEESFLISMSEFVDSSNCEKPIVFEVFTSDKEEREAWYRICNIYSDPKIATKRKIANILGDKGVEVAIKCRQSVIKMINK